MHKRLKEGNLVVLRAFFELADVGMPATEDLLGRLLGVDAAQLAAQLGVLQRAGLVSAERLSLTMAGLMVAVAVEPLQLASMAPRRRQLRLAA